MNNANEAHFVSVPGNEIKHSRFDLSHNSITSFDVGQLIPLTEPIEILPTDNFSVGVGSDITLNTLIYPIMDGLFIDIFEFFVPFRLLWDHYINFEGENDTAPWVQQNTYKMPEITAPDGGWEVGTLADYMCIPTGISGLKVNALKFRGYCKIVKDFFYDQNIQTPPDFITDDATIAGSNGGNYVTDLIKGGKPFVAGKTHDQFTSSLPSPQRGPSVVLPLGNNAPLRTFDDMYSIYGNDGIKLSNDGTTPFSDKYYGSGNNGILGAFGPLPTPAPTEYSRVQYTNVRADLSMATATTVNDLRVAFQTQRLFELMARGGTRYYEILASQWGISAPSGLIQRSEYLGGSRFPLKVHTSVQSSSTEQSGTPQGNLAGYSITTNYKHHFKKGFTERGYLYILGVVRYHHSYSQGLSKSWKRVNRLDFYQNAYAHIGEQPIYNYEIFAQGNDTDNGVFGYNEYGVDYRYCMNKITGQMRPTYQNSLDYMHLGDYYTQLPTLSGDFIKEDKTNVDRVIAATSVTGANQIRATFHFKIDAIRPMPVFAIPGLIDHL